MSSHKNDLQYMNIIRNYINNENFQKTREIEHHGITRFEHSLKVSYYSYRVAKALRLDFEEAAVGGLLHDFFLSPEEMSKKEKVESYFTHPKLALQTALSEFDLTVKEQDMIRSHMFPMNISVPKYMESWIVSVVLLPKNFQLNLSLKLNMHIAYLCYLLLEFLNGMCKLSFESFFVL